MAPLRVLQVGLGGWGRDWAWRIFPDVPTARLIGCVDGNPASLELLRAVVAIPPELCFSTLEEGLAATRPDAVLITTLLPSHVALVRAALGAGKHVLVEKPFAPTLAEARELVGLAEERGRVLMVSQNYRFFPAARAVAGLVKKARLGRVDAIAIDFRRRSPAGPNGRFPHHFDDQPLLRDMSIHHFDLLRFIVGREPASIDCRAWNPPWSIFSGPSVAFATILFDGGPTVSYRGSWLSEGRITPWAGEWRMDFESGEVFWTSRGDESSPAELVTVTRRGRRPVAVRVPHLRGIDRRGVLFEFAGAVRRHREPESSGRDNLGSLALMSAAVDSAASGVPVPVPAGEPQPA